MATAAQVRDLLGATSLPDALVDDLLGEASAAWLMGEPAEVLAGDLALCHPPLAPEEVRAVVKPTSAEAGWRVCVVAHDRPGLLAGTAGALATSGLTITGASATLWPDLGLALLSVTTVHPDGVEVASSDWDVVGERLQAVLGRRQRADPEFVPIPPVRVESTPPEQGRVVVTVEAPDRVGLLWSIASWFESRRCNIEALTITSVDGMARDTFVVVGAPDTMALAAHLGGGPAGMSNLPSNLIRVGVQAVLAGAGVAAGLALRALRANRTD
ncbi:MAG: hypothetical protein QOG64_2253 [Acidimicrobiaceae bacterium]|nr:hypothetical protein [Acidimicrobiaceae bacterium]